MRTVKLTKPLPSTYLSMGEEYAITLPRKPCPYMGEGDVYFRRMPEGICGTFMRYGEFKRYLRDGSIVFTN